MKALYSVIVLACCLCNAAVEPTMRRGEGAKRYVRVVDYGAFSSCFYYTLTDHELLLERFDPPESGVGESTLALRVEVRLRPAAADSLWSNIEALEISRWKERYEPKDLGVEAFDGTSWQVWFRHAGKEQHSSGFNVFPASSPPGKPILEVDERGKLMKSAYHRLRELLHEATRG